MNILKVSHSFLELDTLAELNLDEIKFCEGSLYYLPYVVSREGLIANYECLKSYKFDNKRLVLLDSRKFGINSEKKYVYNMLKSSKELIEIYYKHIIERTLNIMTKTTDSEILSVISEILYRSLTLCFDLDSNIMNIQDYDDLALCLMADDFVSIVSILKELNG